MVYQKTRIEDPKEDLITKYSRKDPKEDPKKKGGGLIFGVLRYWKDVSVGVE